MTNKITIKVTGGAGTGTGKSTIADLLYEFLSESGFCTAKIDYEEFDKSLREKYKDNRIQSVKDNAVIVIEEVHTPKSSQNDN